MDTDVICLELGTQAAQIANSGSVAFHHLYKGDTARGRFKAQGSATGKQIQYVLVAELSAPEVVKPVKQRFAHTIRCGAQAGCIDD